MVRNLLTTSVVSVSMGVLVLFHALVTPPGTDQSTEKPDVSERALLQVEGNTPDPKKTAAKPAQQGLTLFRDQIRPILAGTCLKCHDSNKRSGGLDLTRRETALAGGESGEAIVPEKPLQSLLYQLVTAGEMPREANPLLPQEIAAIKQWIELGAPYEGKLLTAAKGNPTADKKQSSNAQQMDGMMCPCMKMMMGKAVTSDNPLPLLKPLTKDEAGARAEHYLKSFGNPHLKIGKVNETAVSYEVQVLTKDNSLANWIIVDKKTGRMRFLH